MKKTTLSILLAGMLLLPLFQQCKKTTEDWSYCDGCGLDSWVGNFSGTGSHFKAESNEITDGLEVQVEIENPSGLQFLVAILSPDYYSQSFFSSKTDSLYYFSIANQTSSLNMNLSKKGNEFKISGVAKKGHLEWVDSVFIIIPDYSLTFEVFKEQ